MHDHPLPLLPDNLASRTPGEVVHLPERVEREDEGEEGQHEDVDEHPSYATKKEESSIEEERERGEGKGRTDVFEFAMEDVDDDLTSVDDSEHDERERRDGLAVVHDEVDELSERRRGQYR